MKKLISILLLICTLTFCLASCGGKDTNDDNTNSDNSSNNQTEQENHTSYDAFTFYPQSSDTYVVGIAPEGKYYTEIVIPSTYNGGKVVGIVKEGFKDCESLTSIKIPNTVTEIKEAAFYDCKNLTRIEFSNSITKIEKDAFYIYRSDKSVYFNGTISDWVKIQFEGQLVADGWVLTSNPLCYGANLYINGELFTNLIVEEIDSLDKYDIATYFSFCKSLKTVTLSNFDEIYDLSFHGCSSLENVVIPNSVKTISTHAFSECGIKNITIPTSVTQIEENAFYYCQQLKSINYEGTISQWNAINKDKDWLEGKYINCTIYCTDGNITITD